MAAFLCRQVTIEQGDWPNMGTRTSKQIVARLLLLIDD